MRALLLLVLPALLHAHAVSISSGDLTLQGSNAHFILRVPLYETSHLTSPETELLRQLTFSAKGSPATLRKSGCRADRTADQYVCEADYTFAAAADRIDVTCRLFAALVPNHVHLLRVTSGELGGQAAFDASFPQASIELRPQTGFALGVRSALNGAWAATAQLSLWLVLCTLTLAARTRRELAIFLLVLTGGELLILLRPTDYLWKVSPYFVEAALGLTMAYLAGEMVFFRHAGKRWVVVALLAVWLGCYLKINYAASGENTPALLAGFLSTQVLLLVLLYILLLFGRRSRWRDRFRQPAATALMAAGLFWFFWRWWS